MKRILFLIAGAIVSLAALAQGQQMPPLPNDPEVKTGKLDNGITYYIRHNALPEGRAEFYLATDVGAIQEGPGQDGLAHFLEHMCFNGLKNLPGKQMLEYLQHIGAQFGRNINAGTGIEQTQYMLNNIPVTREGIIDTCLLVLHDYSHFVVNDPVEIDAERGVILEEKRTRNSAQWRMFEASLPIMYGDCKYGKCNLIGSEETLKTFKPETIKEYYNTWYRPDMQAVIVVGDIDVDQIYNKLVKLFADIPAPEKPTVKDMPEVPLNDETVVGILTDPENTSTSVEFIWKTGKPSPKEMKGTMMGYLEDVLQSIISRVMSERFNDITSKPGCPILGANFYLGDLCATCEAFQGQVTCENANTKEAMKLFLLEVKKMQQYGFTDDEINRVKENLIKRLKDRIAGESTRKNPEFIRPITNNFFNGYPYMTPETELQVCQQICSMLNAAVVNQALKQGFTGEHLTVLYLGVDQPGQVHPTKDEVLSIIDEVAKTEVQANASEAISSDFMEGVAIKAGKVKKVLAAEYNATEWVLSNGLKVVVLPTQYKKDQVTFELTKKGGLSTIPTEDIASFDQNITQIFNNNSGISKFSNSTVSKMLTGKTVRVSNFIKEASNGVRGNCTPEDIETALQLLNLSFTAPRFDKDEWDVAIQQINGVLPNLVSTPDYAFSSHLYDALYDNNPRCKMLSKETVEKASLETYKKYYQELFSDIAGATLYIVGNVDIDSLKPLVEKYCGSIAKGKKAAKWNSANFPEFKKGEFKDVFNTTMTTPKASVFQFYSAKPEYSLAKEANLTAANFILDMIYTDTLREEEGGTYGASVNMSMNYIPKNVASIQISFDTNTEQQEKLRELAISGIKKLAENGPTEEQLTRTIENAKKNLPEGRITNGYWMGALKYNRQHGGDYDAEFEAAINAISAEGIKAILTEILSTGNEMEVVMLP